MAVLLAVAAKREGQLINPVLLSKVKLGCVPLGIPAVNVKVDGEVTLIVKVTPLVFL